MLQIYVRTNNFPIFKHFTTMIESTKMRWGGHVDLIEEMRKFVQSYNWKT